MNVVEKTVIVPVLFLALGLFFLGFTVIGFVLGMCVAMFLASTTGCKTVQASKGFSTPNGNWSVVYKERRVPVVYSSFARDNVMRFMAGDSHKVELKQERTQQYTGIISVYGHWVDASGGSQYGKLGHIPHHYAKRLLRESAKNPVNLLSAKVSQVFVPAQHKAFGGLALDIALLEALEAGSWTYPCLGRMPVSEHTTGFETSCSMSIGTLRLIDKASV